MSWTDPKPGDRYQSTVTGKTFAFEECLPPDKSGPRYRFKDVNGGPSITVHRFSIINRMRRVDE